MKNKFVFIKRIYQRDNLSFTIEWTDGNITNYLLEELQRNCPCMRCKDREDQDMKPLSKQVLAVRLYNIGRYALKIEFTAGCSKGIYTFSMLRRIKGLM